VIEHDQVAQSAALSGRIDARRVNFAVPTAKIAEIGEKLMQSTAARLCSPALAVAPNRAYLWLVQVVAHGQVAQSAALPGRIDARRDNFAVPTAKIAENR
jgi:hypothetical protein